MLGMRLEQIRAGSVFELWDAESRNVIRCFENASEAEDVLSISVPDRGPAVLNGLFLIREDENEDNELIAEGQAILVAIRRLRSDEVSNITPPSGPRRRVG